MPAADEEVSQKTETRESNDSAKVEQDQKQKQATGVIQEDILFSWIAPARPFKKRSREFWVRVIAISTLASLILFIIEGTIPVLLTVAIVFLFFVMSTVKPDDIEYKITNFGVYAAGRLTGWEMLTRFWFGDRLGNSLLIIEKTEFPGRMEFVVHTPDKKKIREVLRDYLLDEQVPQSNFDRSADWLSKKISG